MSEDQRKGFELRGWHVIVGLLAVLVVMFILFRVFGHSSLERKIAELRAKGYPTSFEELEKYNQLPEGVPNAADLYINAFNAYRAPFEDEKNLLPYIGSFAPKSGEPVPSENKVAMEAFLARNAKTLELLHQAGQIEHCRYTYPLTAPSGFMIPYLTEIKDCAQLLNQFVLMQVEAGKTTEATQGVIEELRLGESMRQEPILVSYLVRLAIDGMGIASLSRILDRQSLSEQQLVDLQVELRTIRQGLRMDQALIGERCFLLDELQVKQSMGFGSAPIQWGGLWDINIVRSMEFVDQLEATTKLEPEQRWTEYQRINNEVDHLSVLFYMTKMLLPAFGTIGMIELRANTQVDCARAALGVERFRLAEGRLPESWDELVPKFIEAVPIDPFDGKPLRYKRLEKGYTIYSVGEDGEDNGGIPKSKVQKDEKFDLPFTVERP
jgi:hypothetical protein